MAALLPALIAGGKAIAAGAVSGAAGYGAKRGLSALFNRKKKKKPATAAQIRDFKRTLRRGNPKGLIHKII